MDHGLLAIGMARFIKCSSGSQLTSEQWETCATRFQHRSHCFCTAAVCTTP